MAGTTPPASAAAAPATGPRRRRRLYYRPGRGWYGDFRDFAAEGGRREALMPAGARRATDAELEALRLLEQRLAQLEQRRALGHRALPADPRIRDYIAYHLERKAFDRRRATVTRDRQALAHVVDFLEARYGADVRLAAVTPLDLEDFLVLRRRDPGTRLGSTVSAQTLLHELHALSSVYKRAIRERRVAENPVTAVEGPALRRTEAVWLELDEAARLLEAAAELDRTPVLHQIPWAGPLIATYLLTGGRRQEIAGLERLEVDLEHQLVHIRPNRWRQLKRDRHRRVVPLWPQLEVILRRYLMQHPRVDLLFPAPLTGGMLKNFRATFQRAVQLAGIEKPVTLHTLRHTYAATRLQTTDQGQPVSPYTVMRELGHSSFALLERTYGHLQRVRSRGSVVEYRRRPDAEQLPLLASRSA